MIFCTVGTQLPFNRMLLDIDNVAKEFPSLEFFSQIGESSYIPNNMEWVRNLDECTYHDYLKRSKILIGHAGMGTIIAAIDYNIPLIMFPRSFKKNEHRNDHQLATAKKFSDRENIFIANTQSELSSILKNLTNKNIESTIQNVGHEFSLKIKHLVCEISR